MNNVPPSVRAALKRRGQDAILQQEGDYQTFKPQIDAILHSDQNINMSDDVMIPDYEEDLSPEEQKATDRIEELGSKYKSEDEYEGSPMKEFSGPEGSDLSYAQLEALKKDDNLKSFLPEDESRKELPKESDFKDRIENARARWAEKREKLKIPFDADLDEERAKQAEEIARKNGYYSPNHYGYINGLMAYEEGEFDENDLKQYLMSIYGKRTNDINKPKYDWKPYNGSDNLDKGGFLRDNEDSNLTTKYASYGPKYKGGSWGRNGYQSFGYDMNQWRGTYHDNMGTLSKSPWFGTKEEAQKWAEERYEKGITEITPERIEELAAKYGQEDIHTENNGYGDVETGRTIHTGLTGKEDLGVLQSTLGQLSDGIWENSRAAERFWKNLDVYRNDDGEIVIDTKTRDYNSPFRGKTPQDVMKYLAQKAKQVVKTEIDDGANAQWDRNSDYELDYMGDSKTPIKISDVYRTYDRLLGRKQKEAKPIESKPAEQSSGKLSNLKKMIDELSDEEMEALFDSIRKSRGNK